jgi:hypothetical protein
MLRGIYGDRQRFIDTYWSTVKVDGMPYYSRATARGATRTATSGSWAASTM